ncbi:hypothetical protein RSK20926_20930 [Roseobacter sp. SK209-2-6]|nr:hypothetical protein RSK20926_20930 [Roseobacter sp. SK209-2-6]
MKTRRVYYYSSSEHAVENLKNQRIKVSRFSQCNDVFELEAVDFSDRSTRETVRKLMKKINDEHGLVCLSRTWKSPIMWSHYADKHKGVCFAFDVNAEESFNVTYSSERFYPGITNENFFQHVSENRMEELFGTKSIEWAYEQEVRLMVPLEGKEPDCDGNFFFGFGGDLCLREVYLGQNSKLTIEDIEEVTQGMNVEVIPTRRAFRTFSVVKQKKKNLWPRRR